MFKNHKRVLGRKPRGLASQASEVYRPYTAKEFRRFVADFCLVLADSATALVPDCYGLAVLLDPSVLSGGHAACSLYHSAQA